ncbi:MAG: hypothetical protein P8J74_01910 [Woeseiaceae bacterium]|nr:hypothetical protein [Woeseiaceae bacterium]
MRNVLTISMLFILGGCAAAPSSIQPASVSRIPYTTMGCKNLEMSLTQEISNLEGLSGEQRSSRNWDIALNLLIIPGFGALTEDQEDEIAQSKGKIIAMQDEFTTRCVEDS